ncbi:bacterial transcriptional activator domain-containing protein [Geomicrobium sp. JCM 19039]|uniref:AfsR/SARP family transcriptional regulator n=1 Tax=Geomicrobium sp. JCM 19039 TaxID=1460636 RepID=UPI00045F3E2F|nr:bacterial transcriptional activator domain-containing protein [Geomicrobium sp. JCM 19039]GAK13291.1 transcriptional regulator [Geomicrobium sp. JCM 19039]
MYIDTIQPKTANHLLHQAAECLEAMDEFRTDKIYELYRLMAENAVNLGDAVSAEKWYSISKKHNMTSYENLEARLLLRTGRLQSAYKRLERQKKLAENRIQRELPNSHRETDLLLSLIQAFMGNSLEAKQLAQQSIIQGIDVQSPFIEACGWMRMGHAIQLSTKYNTHLVIKCYETSLSIMDEIDVARGKAEPFMGLCLLHGKQGNIERALFYGQEALKETERVEDYWLSSLIRLCLGISYIHNDNYTLAKKELDECKQYFLESDERYGQTLALMWQAYNEYRNNKHSLFQSTVRKFIEAVQLENMDYLLQKRTFFGPNDLQVFTPMLLESNGPVSESSEYLNRILKEQNLEDVHIHPGYTVRIQTLGGLKVFLGDKELVEKDWKRGKAKDLLTLFIAKRREQLSKEEIFSILWSGQNEEVADRDFKVALNSLNNVLEPNRLARSKPFFIQRTTSRYGLRFTQSLQMDCNDFEAAVTAGHQAKSREEAMVFYENAIMLYEGDFMSDRNSDEWTVDERERLQVLYIKACEKSAHQLLRTQEYELAIDRAEKIIEKDICFEEAYRILMIGYYHLNNRVYALRSYDKCRRVMNDELGVEPTAELQRMHELLKMGEVLTCVSFMDNR